MVVRGSRLGMRLGKFSRALRAVGVPPMPDARLDTSRGVESVCEVSPGADVLRLLVPSMAVDVIIHRLFVADGAEVMG